VSRALGDGRYVDWPNPLWWRRPTNLTDRDEHLYYRDKPLLRPASSGTGRKCSGAGSNGWVDSPPRADVRDLPPAIPIAAARINEAVSRDGRGHRRHVQGDDEVRKGDRASSTRPAGQPRDEAAPALRVRPRVGLNERLLDLPATPRPVPPRLVGPRARVRADGMLGWSSRSATSRRHHGRDDECTGGALLLAGSEACAARPGGQPLIASRADAETAFNIKIGSTNVSSMISVARLAEVGAQGRRMTRSWLTAHSSCHKLIYTGTHLC